MPARHREDGEIALKVEARLPLSEHLHFQSTEIGDNEQDTQTWVLAGVAQWIECWPVNQRVTNWIPSQGTCLGCGPGLQGVGGGHIRGNHTSMFLSLSSSLPSHL